MALLNPLPHGDGMLIKAFVGLMVLTGEDILYCRDGLLLWLIVFEFEFEFEDRGERGLNKFIDMSDELKPFKLKLFL